FGSLAVPPDDRGDEPGSPPDEFHGGFPARLLWRRSEPPRTAGVIWWNASYSIEAATSVETPAGHFDAYPIRESEPDGTETVSFFAPVAGNHARTEARNGTTQVGTADLVSYRYQALEPPTFLGLTMDRWAFVTIGAAATTVLVVWWFCRRRKRASRDGHGVPVKEAP